MATLNHEQVQLVLRRAAELERDRPVPGHMTRGEVEQIAGEVGIPVDAVQRALAELDTGALAATPPASLLDRVVGPADVVCSRSVPGPVGAVRQAAENFLRGQLLKVKRNLGERGLIWDRAGDWWSRVRRAFGGGGAFPAGSELQSVIVADPADHTRVLVRLVLRLAEPRRHRAWQAAGGMAAGVALATAGAVMLHTLPLEALSILAGSGAAAGSLAAARVTFRRDRERAEAALQRLLDALEHER